MPYPRRRRSDDQGAHVVDFRKAGTWPRSGVSVSSVPPPGLDACVASAYRGDMFATRIRPSQNRLEPSKPSPTRRPQESVDETLRSPGRPLEEPTRAFFAERMGHSFRDVRVHDDARAAGSAKAVGARAYTVGRHVAFGAGAYAPGTAAGDRLLAHELAHVVQQDGRATAPGGPLQIAAPDSAGETQADDLAARALAGQPPTHASGATPSGPVLQRQPEEEGVLPAPQAGQGAPGVAAQQGPGGSTGPGQAATWSSDLVTISWSAFNPEVKGSGWSLAWLRGGGSSQEFTPALKPAVVRSPPQEWAFHTGFSVDSYSSPIPDDRKVFAAGADLKFVTASGKTTLDKHYFDKSPTYFAPGNALGTNPWEFRTVLPIDEPGTLEWMASLSVGKPNVAGGITLLARQSITFVIKP